MTADRVEQMKAGIKRQDEEKEEAFQKRLEEIKRTRHLVGPSRKRRSGD